MKYGFLRSITGLPLILIVALAGYASFGGSPTGLLPSTAAKEIKWNPGHYLGAFSGHLNFNYASPTGAPTKIKGNENFKGVLIGWRWSEIETQRGVYDFSEIFRHINEFRKWSPQVHMVLRIDYRTFNEGHKDRLPEYLYTVNNGTCIWEIDNRHGTRYQYAVWRPECLKFYTDMLDALARTKNPETGQTLNEDPLFEGIKTGESALGGAPLGEDPEFDDWNTPPEEHSYIQGLLSLARHAQSAFPNTMIFLGLNWLVNDTYLQYVADWAAENGIGITGPDMAAWREGDTDGAAALYPGLTGTKDYRGVIPIARENQVSRMLKTIMCGGKTVEDTFYYLIEDPEGPKLTHAFWTRRDDIENCGEIWSWDKSDLANDMRAKQVVAAKNAIINDKCPSSFSGCITVGSVPPSTGSGNNPPLLPEEEACHQLTATSSTSLPPGYAAPWDFFSQAKQTFFKTYCDTTNRLLTLEVGTGTQFEYTYNKGYFLKNNQWQPYTLQCSGSDTIGNWCKGSATATLDFDPSTPDYLLAYHCRLLDNQWKCGCQDQACAKPAWNLQMAEGQ